MLPIFCKTVFSPSFIAKSGRKIEPPKLFG